MTTYTQKDILNCSIVGDYKFYIQTYHSTGMPWSEENCPRFRYKMDAKEWVRLSKPTMKPLKLTGVMVDCGEGE